MIGHDWNMASVRAGVLLHYKQEHIEFADDHLWFIRC